MSKTFLKCCIIFNEETWTEWKLFLPNEFFFICTLLTAIVMKFDRKTMLKRGWLTTNDTVRLIFQYKNKRKIKHTKWIKKQYSNEPNNQTIQWDGNNGKKLWSDKLFTLVIFFLDICVFSSSFFFGWIRKHRYCAEYHLKYRLDLTENNSIGFRLSLMFVVFFAPEIRR